MLCVFSLGHRVGSQHAPASKCCRYISRPVGQGINTMTESLFQRAGKKTKREDDQKGAADRSFRFHKTNPRKRSRGSREDSLFQSERQDCFSVTDEKLYFFSQRHLHTGKAMADMAARDDNNERKLIPNTDSSGSSSRPSNRKAAVCCLFLHSLQFTHANNKIK